MGGQVTKKAEERKTKRNVQKCRGEDSQKSGDKLELGTSTSKNK